MPTRTTGSIGISAGVIVLFCSSFVFFYSRSQQKLSNSKSGIGKDLPAVRLTDLSGRPVDDQVLHKGKVLLVFLSTELWRVPGGKRIFEGRDEPSQRRHFLRPRVLWKTQ